MIRNHRLRVYFDLGRSKGINKMNALAAKLKGNSFYGKMIKDLGCHEGTKSTHEERVVDKALRISFLEINMCLFANFTGWIKEIPGYFKTQEMCNKAVRMEPYSLEFVPDHLKAQEMCNEATCDNSQYFFLFLSVLKYKKCVLRLLR